MKRWMGAAIALIMVVIVGMVTPSLAATASPASGTDDQSASGYSCQGAEVVGIGARGTNSPPGPHGIAHNVIRKVAERSKQKVVELSLDYPASKGESGTPIENYRHSEQRGVMEVRNLLDDLPELCGTNPKVFLVGFSQGAEVMADALAIKPVPADDRIKAVVLDGNLTFNGSEPYDMPQGAGGYKPGQDGKFGRVKNGLAPFADRIQDWCGADDGWCQFYLPQGDDRAHNTDYGSFSDQQAQFVLGKIGG